MILLVRCTCIIFRVGRRRWAVFRPRESVFLDFWFRQQYVRSDAKSDIKYALVVCLLLHTASWHFLEFPFSVASTMYLMQRIGPSANAIALAKVVHVFSSASNLQINPKTQINHHLAYAQSQAWRIDPHRPRGRNRTIAEPLTGLRATLRNTCHVSAKLAADHLVLAPKYRSTHDFWLC